MEGVWQKGPGYRARLKKLNPLRWSKRTIRIIMTVFFMIILPVYLYIGLRPASSLNFEGYPILEIPSIELSTPVAEIFLEERELIAPDSIAGIYHANPNKLFIIGHSSTVFKELNKVAVGERLNYEQKSYKITSVETLAKADISMNDLLAEADEETIVIMTCAGKSLPKRDATHRLIVTAKLQE